MSCNYEKYLFMLKVHEVKTQILLSKTDPEFLAILPHEKELIGAFIESEILEVEEKFLLFRK